MSTRELLELASLDALGLLDDEERESFESAFRAAPTEVQSRVRREQARFAQADHLLPPVEPPVGLRAAVIARVREAIASVRGDDGAVLASIGAAPSRNHMPIWRAACIGFATATAVLGVLYLTVAQQNQTMESLAESGALSTVLQEMGPRAQDVLLADHAQRVRFVPAAADVHESVRATLHFDPDTGDAILLCEGLPVVDGTYTIVIRDGDGEVRIKDFSGTGGKVPVFLEDIDANRVAGLGIDGPATQGASVITLLTVGDL